MKNRLISFILALILLIAVPLSAIYKYNPYTRKLDYYERVEDSDLGDLGDVTIAGLATGDILYYNGAVWVNLTIGAGATVLTVAAGIPSWQAAGAPGAHAASHEVGGADLVDHDQLTNYLAAQHLTLPNTIVAVLTDHNLVAHTALGLFDASADVDHNATTNYAANQHVVLPNTIANVLSDHNLAAHPATIGGTGLGVYVIGDILYASGVGTLSRLADVAVGSALISGGVGVAPTWSTDLATGMTIGTAYVYRVGGTDVAVADGGTGLGSYTTGDIVYASGAGTLAGLADVAVGQALMSGGVGAAPTWDASPSFTGLVSSVGLTTTSTVNISTADLPGIVFGSLGTATRGIDLSSSGLAGADYWIYGSATNYWTASGALKATTINTDTINSVSGARVFYRGVGGNTTNKYFIFPAEVSTHPGWIFTTHGSSVLNHDHGANTDPIIFIHSAISPDTDNTQWMSFSHDQTDGVIETGKGSIKLSIDSARSILFGNKTPIGSFEDCTVAGASAVIAKATIDDNAAIGDLVHVTAGTGITTGFYRVIDRSTPDEITVDRNVSGAGDTDIDVTLYKDVIGFFATDGVNGQRIMNYSHQDKPLQIGGDVLIATTGGMGSEDVLIGGNKKAVAYNRYDYIAWNDCFDHGSTVAKYGQDWDLTALNTQGGGSNTIQTNPSHITLTTDNNAIGDNEGTRTDYQIIERLRLNRTEFGMTLGQTVNTQYYMGWNTSGTNAMVAAADEYVIVFFDVSDNANWQIKVGDGATEDVFTSAVAGAATFIRHDIWVESDGTVHWSVNGTELDITGTVDNLMTASDHYLIVGQAQSVTGAAAIVAEICFVENEKTKAN